MWRLLRALPALLSFRERKFLVGRMAAERHF